MAAPAGEGGATARALRAESRTPPSALMERPRLPRRGGARSDTGPGGAGWAGRWLRSSAAPAPLNTPRPTWRTLNLDWPPLSANPSATAIPTLHRAGARAQRRPGERARGAGTAARARQRGESAGTARGGRRQSAAAGTGAAAAAAALCDPAGRTRLRSAAFRCPPLPRGRRQPLVRRLGRCLPRGSLPLTDPQPVPGRWGEGVVVQPGRSRRRRAAGAARPERVARLLAHLPLGPAVGPPVPVGARRPHQRPQRRPRACAALEGSGAPSPAAALPAPSGPPPLADPSARSRSRREKGGARREELRAAVRALRCGHVNRSNSRLH